MKRLLFSCLTILVLSLTTACSSDEEYDLYGTLYGVVTDAATGEPVANVSVQLQPGGATKITGSNGYFEFIELTAQQYTLTVQKSGYSTNRKSVTAISGEKVEANITIAKP